MSEGMNKKRDREHTGPTHILAIQRCCEEHDVFFSTRQIEDITLAEACLLSDSTPSSRSKLSNQIKTKLGIRLGGDDEEDGEEFNEDTWTNLDASVVTKFTNDHHCIIVDMYANE